MSVLKEKVFKDMTKALKNKETERLGTLRLLQAAIKNREIELRPELVTDSDILSVIKKQIKQTEESIECFEKAGDGAGVAERLQEEKDRLSVLKEYLPPAPSKERLAEILEEIVAEARPQSMKDMGRVMKIFREKAGPGADGKLLASLVKERLNRL